MNNYVMIIIWIVLLTIPVIAAFKRYWIPFSIYLVGLGIFIYDTVKVSDGWDDLASFATLTVVVIPIYIVGSIVWTISYMRRRKTLKSNK